MSTSFESIIDAEMAGEAPAVDPSIHAQRSETPFEAKLDHEIALEEHSSVPQQALTALEGGAEGFFGPLATGAERLLHKAGVPGLSPEDQALRQEASPYLHGGAKAGALIGGALTGTGLPGMLARAGSSAAQKIGSRAVQGLIEGGLYQGGNEVSKLINGDPNQTVGSAVAHVGLSGLIGGALTGGPSAVSALWKKTAGEKTAGVLRSISRKLGGIEGVADEGAASSAAQGLEKKWEFPIQKRDGSASTRSFDEMKTQKSPTTWAEKISSHIPEAATALASHLMGHGALSGYVVGHLGKALLKDVPEVTRHMLLKWLGTAKPIDSSAFKAGAEFMHAAIKGNNLVKKAAKSVFDTGAKIIPEHLYNEQDRLKSLDKKLKEIQVNPGLLEKMDDTTSYYLPDQGIAIAAQTARASNYANQMRPVIPKTAPLDPDIEPNPVQKYAFNQVLQIAEQPLIVMDYLKLGTLTTDDMQHLTNMYPELYQNMKINLMTEMVDHLASGNDVSYQTRFGLSQFFGQPMDSSFTPEMVLSNQLAFGMAQSNESSKQAKPTVGGLSKMKSDTRLSLNPPESQA